MEKQITVAIPHYHAVNYDNRYLIDCLRSIMLQTMYEKCDIILYDDASPNFEIVEKIIKKLGINITVIRGLVNLGVGAARNQIIDACTTPYIYFLDSDDMFALVDSLEILYKEMNDCDVVVGNFIEENYNTLNQKIHIIHDKDRVCVHGKMYRIDYLLENDIRFPENIKVHEDANFNLRVIQSARTKIKYIDKSVLLWRYRKESITRENDREYTHTEHVTYMKQFLDGFKKTKDIIEPVRLFCAFLAHGYVSAQNSVDANRIKEAKEVEDYTNKIIMANHKFLSKIPYIMVKESFSAQIQHTLPKMGSLLMSEDIFSWFKRLGWDFKNNGTFDEKDVIFEIIVPK